MGMIWYKHMFLGKKCRKSANRLQYKIANRLPHSSVYLIVLTDNQNAVLEIIPSAVLMQKVYPADGLRIVGMASTKQEAFSLVEEILGEVYREWGDVSGIEEYLEQYR